MIPYSPHLRPASFFGKIIVSISPLVEVWGWCNAFHPLHEGGEVWQPTPSPQNSTPRDFDRVSDVRDFMPLKYYFALYVIIS